MESARNNAKTPSEYAKARGDLLTEGFKGLLLVNGGGAVALLAFLQAVWEKDRALAGYVLVSIAWMSGGLVAAMLVPWLRHFHSKLAEKAEAPGESRGSRLTPWERRRKRFLQTTFTMCQFGSVLCFVVAIFYLYFKARTLLP